MTTNSQARVVWLMFHPKTYTPTALTASTMSDRTCISSEILQNHWNVNDSVLKINSSDLHNRTQQTCHVLQHTNYSEWEQIQTFFISRHTKFFQSTCFSKCMWEYVSVRQQNTATHARESLGRLIGDRHLCNPQARQKFSNNIFFKQNVTHDNKQSSQSSLINVSSQNIHANSTDTFHCDEQDMYSRKLLRSKPMKRERIVLKIRLWCCPQQRTTDVPCYVTNKQFWMRTNSKVFISCEFFQSSTFFCVHMWTRECSTTNYCCTCTWMSCLTVQRKQRNLCNPASTWQNFQATHLFKQNATHGNKRMTRSYLWTVVPLRTRISSTDNIYLVEQDMHFSKTVQHQWHVTILFWKVAPQPIQNRAQHTSSVL